MLLRCTLYTFLGFVFCSLFSQDMSAQCGITVSAGDDIFLCAPPSPTQLDGSIIGDYLSFTWSPTNGMTGSNTLNPTVNVTQTTSYILSVSAADLNNNLVVNGDFEGGNFGFSSDYGYSPGNLVPEGLYDVLDNPQDDHAGFAPCDDHTTGAGNMMVVNGAGTPNQDVWCQTVAVTPNSQYVLSAWVTSVVASSPALLQFSINGSTLGPIFTAPGQVCNWQNYFQVWNSGGNSSATICIVNQNTALGGNDFALDDIVFAPVCTARDTVKVTVVNVNAVAAPSVMTIPCEGANITLSGVGSSTGAEISYLWDTPDGNIVSGATTLNPVVNAPGAYTLTVTYTAPNGTICEKTATVNVILNPNPLLAWINPPQPLGCGSTTIPLIGNTNQTGFAAYQWSTADGNIVSGENQKTCMVDQVGTYQLTVTNTSTGCTATAEVTVTATTTPPLANAAFSDTLTCFQDTIQLLSAGSSTGPNISYAWSTINGHIVSGQNSATALADTTGLYILSVTNTTNNCTSRDTVQVIGNLTPPHLFLPPQQQLTCTVDTIYMIVYLYPPPFVLINWTATDGGHIVSGEHTPNPQIDAQGNYHVTVQDPINGCISTGSAFVVNNINYPDAQILNPGQITCQSPSIALSGAGSSTGPDFVYQWVAGNGGNIVSGHNTLNPVVNAAGDYTLTVLDTTNSCFSSASTAVIADTNVVMVFANVSDTLTCTLDTVSLNANGSSTGPNITYAWTTTDGHIVGGADTPNPLVDATGTYQLLVTNTDNGCAGTDLAFVAQNITAPSLSISQPAEITCINPSQTLNGQNNSGPGQFSYLWTAGNGGNLIAGQTTLSPQIDAPGQYTLTATNLLNGCTASVTTSVNIANDVPVAAAAVAGPLTCSLTQQVLNGAGSSAGNEISYQWQALSGGNIVGNTSSQNANADAPGTYVLTVLNNTNGCIASDTVVLTANILAPIADAGLPDTLTCFQPQLTLSAAGPATLSFLWNTFNGQLSGPLDQASVTASLPGEYILTVVDPVNGCSATDTVSIAQNQLAPVLVASPAGTLDCATLQQTIDVQNQQTGLFSYVWSGNPVAGNNTLTPVVDQAGSYTLTATNLANGCTASLTVTIAQDTAAPQLNLAPPGVVTCAAPEQTILAQNLSLPGNFSYAWMASNGGTITNGANTLSPSVSTGGTYLLTALNLSNGCSSTLSVQVTQDNTPPLADAGVDATLTCQQNNLSLNGGGSGAAGLLFNWTATAGGNILSGGNTPAPVIDAPGLYSLTVLNPANGCSDTDVVEIFNDANAPSVVAAPAPELTCTLTQTNLSATASTGPTFTYAWTAANGGNIVGSTNTLTPAIDQPGLYTLVVTNTLNGCTRSASISVTQNIQPPGVDAGIANTLTCQTTSLNLSGNSTGGPATFQWQTSGGNILSGGNSLNPLIDQAGTYTLTATLTANGCTASDQVLVNIDTLPPAFILAQPQLLTCTQLSTPLSGQVQQPASGNYSALWNTVNGHFSGPQNTLSTTVDAPGTYVLNILNTQNGCSSTQSIIVNQNIVPPTAQAASGGAITCANPTITLSGNGSSAGTYLWSASQGGNIISGNSSLSPVVSAAGTYTLMVTDLNNGCTATAVAVVQNNTQPPVVAIAAPPALTCTVTAFPLDAAASSSGPNFQVWWNTTGGNILSGQNSLSPLVDAPGSYLLTIQNLQNGCTATAQVSVTENLALPEVEAGNGGELHCNLPQLNLNGSSATPGNVNFSWSTADGHFSSAPQGAHALVDQAGIYTLIATHPMSGCTASDLVIVTEASAPVFSPILEQPNCHRRTGAAQFGQTSGGQAPYVYSFDGGITFGNQSLAADLTPNTYTLVLEDAYGCTTSADIVINPPFLPTLTIPTVDVLAVGDSVRLLPSTNIPAGQVAAWQWTPAEGLSCSDCPQPWAKPLRSIKYELEVTDADGCSARVTVPLRVDRRRQIYAPNVFSPDDDGENDRFVIYGKGVRTIRSLRIYDRWGTALWLGENLEAGDESAGWDGRYRGDELNPAVFVWYAEIEFIDGEVELFYGDVTLVR